MVAHSSRFNVLAVFCSLAALSLSPLSASALAIQARDSTSSSKHVLARSPGRQETFILSLPYHATKQSASKKNKDKSSSSTKGKPTSRISRRYYEDGDLAHVERRSSDILLRADAQAHVKLESQKDGAGRVDVMSPALEGFKKIASLWIPEGTTALKASDTNHTKFYMVPVAGSRPASLEPAEHLVRVIADGVTTDGVSYCITTNTEKESSAMTAQACYNSDGNSTVSQLFAHNDNTGVVRPMQPVGNDTNGEDGQHNSTADSTSPNNGSVEAAQSFFGERDIGGADGAQNVTLMFVPDTQAANAEDMPQVTVVTATSTMTTTYTITTSMTASVSAADVTPTSTVTSSDSTGTSTLSSVSAADVSPTSTVVSSSISPVTSSSTLPASAVPTSSFSFETSTITVVAAAASSTSESVSSSSSTVPSVTSVPTLAALDVQVVAQATSSSGSDSITVTSTSTSSMSSPTVNAEEIASKIAASFASVADVVSSAVMSTTTDGATSTTSGTPRSATSTSVPSLTLRGTAPYVWVYKARKE